MNTTDMIVGIILSVATGLLSAVIIGHPWWHSKQLPFSLKDLADPSALIARLRDAQDSVSQYLFWRIPPDAQAELKKFDGSRPPSQSILQTVIAMLNQLVGDSYFFDERRFENVSLRNRTRKLISRGLDDDLALLNRMLLEDAYPSEIVKRSQPKSPDARIVATALAIIVFAILSTVWSPSKVLDRKQVPEVVRDAPSVPTGSSTTSILGVTSAAGDANGLIPVIKHLQETHVGESFGLEASDCFTEARLNIFLQSGTVNEIVDLLKANPEFLTAVQEIRALPQAQRENLLRKAQATYKPTWDELGLDPTINTREELRQGQTRAGQKAERMIAQATVNLASSLLMKRTS